MKTNILILAVLSSLSTGTFAQSSSPQSNSDIEVTAVVEAGCYLTADNINFGVLQMPLNDQSASSNINVQCSKGANLQLAIAYNSQGQVSSGGNYTVQRHDAGTAAEFVKVYKDGQRISSSTYDIECNIGAKNKVWIYSQEMKSLLNAPVISGYIPDQWGMCSGNRVTYDVLISSISDETGGSLVGLSSSEQINYFLTVPNTNNTWGGNTQYELLATGVEQTIPIKANIKRADNPTHRLTPDTYQSTLTVVLNY